MKKKYVPKQQAERRVNDLRKEHSSAATELGSAKGNCARPMQFPPIEE